MRRVLNFKDQYDEVLPRAKLKPSVETSQCDTGALSSFTGDVLYF